MAGLKNQISELGYDVLGLSTAVYVPSDIMTADSCDGGCTTRCISCKVEKKDGVVIQ